MPGGGSINCAALETRHTVARRKVGGAWLCATVAWAPAAVCAPAAVRRLLRRYWRSCDSPVPAVADGVLGPPRDGWRSAPTSGRAAGPTRGRVVLLAAARREREGGREAVGEAGRAGRAARPVQLTRCAVIGVGTAVPSGPTVCTIAAGRYPLRRVRRARSRRAPASRRPPRAVPWGIGRAAAAALDGEAGGWRQYGPPVYEQMCGAWRPHPRSGTCGDGGEGGVTGGGGAGRRGG